MKTKMFSMRVCSGMMRPERANKKMTFLYTLFRQCVDVDVDVDATAGCVTYQTQPTRKAQLVFYSTLSTLAMYYTQHREMTSDQLWLWTVYSGMRIRDFLPDETRLLRVIHVLILGLFLFFSLLLLPLNFIYKYC